MSNLHFTSGHRYSPHSNSHFSDAMEELTPNSPKSPLKSAADTSRPFRSVKETVAIFGEQFLEAELYAASPSAPSLQISPEESPTKSSPNFTKTKKLTVFEALKKLEANLQELKVELQLLKERESDTETALASLNAELHRNMSKPGKGTSCRYKGGKKTKMRTEESPTLAEILKMGEKKMEKKKPIMPLVTDVIAIIKRSSSSQLCK